MKPLLIVLSSCFLACSAPAIAADQPTDSMLPFVTPQVLELRKTMEQDESIMATIQALQEDPEVQAILSDPDLMHAIQTNDTAALMTNEKFLAIMNNPRIKSIQRRINSH